MLEGIDEARFAKASHAYGKAKDVPNFLRGLLARTDKARGEALFNLSSAICHQGTLYTATSLAVPHLLEIVASPKAKGRADILRLLADIVTLDDHERFLLGYPDRLPSDLPASFAKAIKAVWAGSEVVTGLLADKDAHVRSAAAFLLAWMPKSNAPAVAAALAKEKDETVKASLTLALGYLDPKASFELGGKTIALKTAAALATSTVKKGEIDDEARALIVAAAKKRSLKVGGLPFVGGDLASFAVQVLAALPDSAEDLIGAVEAGGSSSMFAANVVVRKLFEKKKGKPPPRGRPVERRDKEDERILAELPVKIADLDPTQRRFLDALTKLDGFDSSLSDALGERGLPPAKELLATWLGGVTKAATSILDRPATFEGKATTLGDLYIQATVPASLPKPEVIAAIEASTSVEERIELALKGFEVIEVSWSGMVAADLIARNAPKAPPRSMAAIDALGKKGGLYAVAAGAAHVARAVAAGKVPDPKVDKLLQEAYEYSPIAKRALASLPVERREKWILHPKRDDRAQPAEFFAGAWRYFDTCPTTKIANRALQHVAAWKPNDPWGGSRKKFADPVLKALADAFRAAGNDADATRLDEAYAKLK